MMAHKYMEFLFDQLLYWCSFKRNGTWEIFRKACKNLGISHGMTIDAWRTKNIMSALGHIDFGSEDPIRWQKARFKISPPTIVLLPSSSGKKEKAMLCGWRSPNLIERLEKIVNISIDQTGSQYQPQRILIEGNRKLFTDISKELKLEWADIAAEKLMRLLPPLTNWIKSTTHSPVKDIGIDIEYWDVKNEKWKNDRFFSSEYVSLYRSKKDKPRRYWLKDNNDYRGIMRNIGFLLVNKKTDPYLSYNHWKRVLAIKKYHFCYLPQLFKRALVLCSGLLPYCDRNYYKFQDVPYDIAKGLAERFETTLGDA